MMGKWRKIGIGSLFALFLSIASMTVFDSSDFSSARISDGTALANLLGGMVFFSLAGLIGYVAFGRSLMAFCVTAAVVTIVSSISEISEPQNSPQRHTDSSSNVPTNSATLLAADQIEKLLPRVGLDEVMDAVVAESQKNLPMKMNQLDQVVSIIYLPSRDLQIYKHIVSDGWEASIPALRENSTTKRKEAVMQLLEGLGINSACSNAIMAQLINYGLRINHVYHDTSGFELLQFEVNKERCQQSERT